MSAHDSEQTKICVACGVSLPLDRFTRDSAKRDKKSIKCKSCLYAYQRGRRSGKKTPEVSPDSEKQCRRCGVTKLVTAFPRHDSHADGHRNTCTACVREDSREKYQRLPPIEKKRWSNKTRNQRLFREHGLSPEDFENLLGSQGGRCAICRIPQEALGRRLDTDHCHDKGTVRGLLCNPCNRMLGVSNDSVQVLREAADYLEYWEGVHEILEGIPPHEFHEFSVFDEQNERDSPEDFIPRPGSA